MKTPYEIKKGLYICYVQPGGRTCNECPYFIDDASDCDCAPGKDALAYIQQLEHSIGELTEKVEQIKAEQQNLICDFMDYINDGAQNPAPYCVFGGSCVLVDKRGWCRPGEHGCNGFVPKVRDDNENA